GSFSQKFTNRQTSSGWRETGGFINPLPRSADQSASRRIRLHWANLSKRKPLPVFFPSCLSIHRGSRSDGRRSPVSLPRYARKFGYLLLATRGLSRRHNASSSPPRSPLHRAQHGG